MKSILVRVASGLSVAKLLEALNQTTEFEQETAKRLGMPVCLDTQSLTVKFAEIAIVCSLSRSRRCRRSRTEQP